MLSVSAAKRIGFPDPETVNTRVADVESEIARFAKRDIPPGAVMLARGVRSRSAVKVTAQAVLHPLEASVTVTDAPINKS